MNDHKVSTVHIALRRFAHSSESESVVEIYLTNIPDSDRLAFEEPICRFSSIEDNETTIFHLDLANGVAVKPVDWRRFAYDNEMVSSLVTRCVNDNINNIIFEPASDEIARQLEYRLLTALLDLSSIFETKSVHCDFSPEELLVTIHGEHKNGERRELLCSSRLNA